MLVDLQWTPILPEGVQGMRRQGILRCPNCQLWRPWQAWVLRPLIDRDCVKCNKRIRVQLDRKPGGRPSTVEVRELPADMPQHAVLKMTRAHNKFERQGGRLGWIARNGDDQGFTNASEIVPIVNEKEARTNLRNMVSDEWDQIIELLNREVGESENEM